MSAMVILFNQAKRMPWEGKTSIYDHIRQQGGTVDGSLPDDEEFWAGSRMRWVAGGLDGALGHHAAPAGASEDVRELIRLLVKLTRKPGTLKRKAVYEQLMKLDIGGSIDAVLEEIRQAPGIEPEPLFYEAKWFAECGAHRNVVKFGMAVLGLFRNEAAKDLLLTLGRHEEFTLYAAVAITNGMENSNDVLFELAQTVHGWGKIHTVERLQPDTPEIRAWLLRYGCPNSVMDEYLACICARNGELHEALSASRVDDELFEGATDIIQALLHGGPAEDIDDYEFAPQVVTDYVRLAEEQGRTAKHLTVILELREYLDASDEGWVQRLTAGWTEERRQAAADACERILSKPLWQEVVTGAVKSGSPTEQWYGVSAARRLGVDIWQELFAQLTVNPLLDSHYLELMKSNDSMRIRELVDFAGQRLPLAEIASGPGEEMGFGEEFAAHRCLSSILQNLDRHEGIGLELIAAGLNSPVVNNRHMALTALEAWTAASWKARLSEVLVQVLAVDPDESVRERIRSLLEEIGISNEQAAQGET
ncbi:limonene hydroxylase [Paenibacillus lactis]|uniref:limonene hydroxylase n=1 Tax=Paenibacillus lactis TaxID=228574 RepID=UPI001FD2D57F|nr:limonene hydroxylase [Paenibacillus lactis]